MSSAIRLTRHEIRLVQSRGRVITMVSSVAFRVEGAPTVSIVVVAWRTARYVFDCLTSIKASVRGVAYEVILVLNEPTTELESQVDEHLRGTTTLRTRANVGFAGAVNLGAAKARGDYLVLLNDDAEASPGWLEALVETAERNSGLGAVGSKVLFPDGTVQELGAVVWSDGSTANVGRGLPGDNARYGYERRVDYCSGCSILIRRSTWLQLEGLSEEYFPAYYEDVDLCIRIRAIGQDVVVQPRSVVVHRLSASTSGPYRSFLMEHNRGLLASRWSPVLETHEPPAEDDFAVDRAVSRSMGEPMNVLVVIDEELAGPAIDHALERAPCVAAALLGSSPWRLVVASMGPSGAAAVRTAPADPARVSLHEVLERIEAPYPLVLVAARADRFEAAIGLVRVALPGVVTILDAGDLLVESDKDEADSVADLYASAALDYVICRETAIGQLTGERGGRLAVAPEVFLVPVRPAAEAPAAEGVTDDEAEVGHLGERGRDERERITAPGARGVVTAGSTVALTGLSALTHAELRAVERDIRLKELYVRWLEERVERGIADIDRRDRYVERTEAFALRSEAYARRTEAYAQRTEAYARELQAQVEQLAAEIESKNVYILEKEGDLVRLAKENSWLQEKLGRADAALAQLKNGHPAG